MTFLLIVVIIAIGVSIYQAGEWKKKESSYKKKNTTNIPLQKELIAKHYDELNSEIITHGNDNPILTNEQLFDYIEFLFEKYNLPDFRTEEQKSEDRKKYLLCANQYFSNTVSFSSEQEVAFDTIQDASKVNLLERIFLQSKPFSSDILFGTRNTKVEFNGLTYKYDYRGFIEISNNPLCKLYWTAIQLLTEKELKSRGYKYSYNFKESEWQRREADIEKYNENKDRYPWYFD